MTRFIVDIEDPKKIKHFNDLMEKEGFKVSSQENEVLDSEDIRIMNEILTEDKEVFEKLAK